MERLGVGHGCSPPGAFPLPTAKYYKQNMPNTKTAKKALRQNVRRRTKNIKQKKALREVVKAYKKSPDAEKLSAVYKSLDKAAKVNLIKKNKASRLKSRLSKKLAQTS
jgi:small subunit ribosomal protein S20